MVEKLSQGLASRWDTLAFCGCCGRGILASFLVSGIVAPTDLLKNYEPSMLKDLRVFPMRPNTEAPAHTPENVGKFYKQGTDNLPGNYDAAGMMFRKALDVSLKVKFPDIDGTLTLYQRITEAEQQQGLTPDLAEWAHQIRLDGNDAAHEEEPFSKEDAESLHTFTELVLHYLFTLPGMLAEARGVPDAPNAEQGGST